MRPSDASKMKVVQSGGGGRHATRKWNELPRKQKVVKTNLLLFVGRRHDNFCSNVGHESQILSFSDRCSSPAVPTAARGYSVLPLISSRRFISSTDAGASMPVALEAILAHPRRFTTDAQACRLLPKLYVQCKRHVRVTPDATCRAGRALRRTNRMYSTPRTGRGKLKRRSNLEFMFCSPRIGRNEHPCK